MGKDYAEEFTDFPFKSSDSNRFVKLPRWQYGLLRPYNGFTGIERIQSWQLTMWAVRVGVLRTPSICSISDVTGGFPYDIQYHNENYYDPLAPHQIHKLIHQTLHRRFDHPYKWEMVKSKYGIGRDDDWFMQIPMEEPNFAAQLRKQGYNRESMVRNFIKRLPSGSPKLYGKFHTRSDFDDEGKLINA